MTYYDDIADGYDELYSEEQRKKYDFVLGLDVIRETDSILDVGCGTGLFLDYVQCTSVVGIEPSSKLLDCYSGDKKVVVGIAEKLPFEDSSFNSVVSFTAVLNFSDVIAGLSEMKRVSSRLIVVTTLAHSPTVEIIKKECVDGLFSDCEVKDYYDEKEHYFIIVKLN